jgi:maleylacetoacetate isomerase
MAAARVRRVMDIIACDIHPIGNIGVLEDLMSRFGVDMTTALTFKTDWVLHGFQGLEPVVADLRGQGPFVMGDVFTAADIYVTAQVYNARRSDVDMNRFPALQAVEKACLELDIFDQSKPEAQTDAH